MPRPSALQQLRTLLPTKQPATIDEAKQIAERQAYKLLHLLGVTEPSVDMTGIIDLPHIRVRVTEALPVSGLSYWSGDHWDIAVRGNDSSTRRRFTLAHEFKHIIDHPHIDVLYPGLDTDDKIAKQVETICDHFAACLLMPALWVEREWSRGIREPTTLARIFKVSPVAMKIRLAALDMGGGPSSGRPVEAGDVRSYFRLCPASVFVPVVGPVPLWAIWRAVEARASLSATTQEETTNTN